MQIQISEDIPSLTNHLEDIFTPLEVLYCNCMQEILHSFIFVLFAEIFETKESRNEAYYNKYVNTHFLVRNFQFWYYLT